MWIWPTGFLQEPYKHTHTLLLSTLFFTMRVKWLFKVVRIVLVLLSASLRRILYLVLCYLALLDVFAPTASTASTTTSSHQSFQSEYVQSRPNRPIKWLAFGRTRLTRSNLVATPSTQHNNNGGHYQRNQRISFWIQTGTKRNHSKDTLPLQLPCYQRQQTAWLVEPRINQTNRNTRSQAQGG